MAGTPYAPPFEAQFDPDRAQEWIITKLLRRIHTSTPVRVLKVTPVSGTVGFVDVQPLVLDQATNGNVIPQTPIYHIPYLRLQGGASAIVLDPAVDDLGLCLFAERDTTNAIKTRAEGAAPTDRTHSSADGWYVGGFLNGDPTQYVKFLADGGIDIYAQGDLNLQAEGDINLHAAGDVHITATNFIVDAVAQFNQDVTAPALHLPNGEVNAHVHNETGTVTGPMHD